MTALAALLPSLPRPAAADARPKPDCAECRDTGFVLVRANGVEAVKPCVCRMVGAQNALAAVADIPPRFARCEFDNYEAALSQYAQHSAKQRMQRLVALYPRVRGMLLMGPPGTGKTHLAVAALRALMQRKRVTTRFYDFIAVLNAVQHSFDKNAERSKRQVLAPLIETPVVLIDDLGSAQMSAFALDTLTHILNERYNHERLTLITTNYLDPEHVAYPTDDTLERRIGSRLRSRLCQMCDTLLVQGDDYRRKAAR